MLLGKILSRKSINKSDLREAIVDFGRLMGGFNLKEMEGDLWLFSFDLEAKRKHLLDMEPYNFHNSNVLLKEIIIFQTCLFTPILAILVKFIYQNGQNVYFAKYSF